MAGDLGPTGELLVPLGELTAEEAASYFAEQAAGLAAGGVDLFLVETISDLAELEAAVTGIRSVAADAPIVATMSFDTNLRTMMGVKPADAVAKGIALGLVAVGANCGRGPVEMEQIAAEMVGARGDADILLIAQSNAGLPHVVGDHFEYDAGPEVMAAHASALRALGIDVIGACCGSTPEHLTAMTQALAAASDAS